MHRGSAPGIVSYTRKNTSASCYKSFALGWVTVPMTHPLPQITAASQTVVFTPLNSFQQGSIVNSPRTISGRSFARMESHPNGVYFVLPYVGLPFDWVTCLVARPTNLRPCNYLSTEGKRKQRRLHLALVRALVATTERGNPEITVRLG